MNPMNLTGPEFLFLFLALLLAALGASLLLRWSLRLPVESDDFPRDLDVYQLAQLSEGGERAVDAAIASLVHAGALKVDRSTRSIAITGKMPVALHDLERTILDALRPMTPMRSIDSIRHEAKPMCRMIEEELIRLGLVVDDRQASQARLWSAVPLFLTLAFGAPRIMVGLSRGKPVGFLVVLCLVAGVAGLGMGFARPHRSRLGDLALERFRRRHAALESTASSNAGSLEPKDLARAMALFGVGVLSGGVLDELRLTLSPPRSSSSHGGNRHNPDSPSSGGGGGGGGCGGCGG